jgi:glycosyltransferase involved in cell wall biosynthesis
MRIAIDASRALKGNPTGTERYAFEIIRNLLALPAARAHEWLLYLPHDLPAAQAGPTAQAGPAAQAGPTAHALLRGAPATLRVLPQTRGWTHRRLGPALERDRPDVLFVPAHVLPLMAPGHLPPSVVTVHDLGYLHLPATHTASQRLYLEASTRYAVRHATRLIAVSHATARDLRSAYHADSARLRVVHEAAAPAAPVTPAAVTATQARYGLARPYALFIGTLQPRKNLLRMAHAVATLHAAGHVHFDLVLAGAPGWKSAPLLTDLATLGLGNRLRLTGYLPDADAAALLHGALFFCYASLFEGFGLPVLEAQQAGVPVLTANNSSLPEIAADAALLVDPNNVDAIAAAMLRLSLDENLRAALIAAGHENVKRFSWEKAAAETLAVLEEAAKGP